MIDKSEKLLADILEQDVKFSEVDSLGIVWHGHYVRYFEDGRESFGRTHGMGYNDFYSNGYFVPIINLQVDYKHFLRYGERMIIETTYKPCEAAKINLSYKLLNAATGQLLVTGITTQVFLNKTDMTLQLTNPHFFQKWKLSNGLI